MVYRTVIMATKRVPTIQFRFGANAGAAAGQASAAAASPAGAVASVQSNRPAAIEDYELPERYYRKAFSQEEIDYINRGGPE